MRTLVRLAPAFVAALFLAAPAHAAYTSARLTVLNSSRELGASGQLTLRYSQAALDEPTARVVTYVPRGYVSSLAPAADTELGTGRATLVVDGRRLTATGSLVSAEAARYRDEADACAGSSTRVDAVYVLELAEAGQPVLELPVFVRTVTSGREAAYASGALTVCFPGAEPAALADAPPRVLALSLAFPRLFANPRKAGTYRWRSLWTPYRDGLRVAAETVEAQALDVLPGQLTLATGRFDRRTRKLFVGGTMLEGGRPLPGGAVELLAGRTDRSVRRIALTRTNANGNYGGRLALPVGTWHLQAKATVRARTRNGCSVRTAPAVRCLRTTTSGFTLVSPTIRAVVPPRDAPAPRVRP